jgi:SLOG cluster2
MKQLQRPLAGRSIGISISDSEQSEQIGFPNWQVNRVTVQIVSAMFGQGLSAVFGHDWRDDGVMEAIHSFAAQLQPSVPLPPEEASATNEPLMQNFVPWPDAPRLSSGELERLSSTLRVEPAGLPEELAAAGEAAKRPGAPPRLYPFVRARALTHLRHKLEYATEARLAMGGRRDGYAGRYPGIVEEALFTLRAQKALYLAGLLGGATRDVIDAIQGRPIPEDLARQTEAQTLYADPPYREIDPGTLDDRTVDMAAVWLEFQHAGVEQLARQNGLSIAENRELSDTPAVDRVIELVLVGMSRLN